MLLYIPVKIPDSKFGMMNIRLDLSQCNMLYSRHIHMVCCPLSDPVLDLDRGTGCQRTNAVPESQARAGSVVKTSEGDPANGHRLLEVKTSLLQTETRTGP